MFPIEDPILQFTVLVLAALVAQLTVERLRLPGLLGLLVLGILLGPGGFDLLPREPVVDLLGQVGLVYIMFLAGLEIDLDVVREHVGETVQFGLLAFVCCLVPTSVVALVFLGFDLAAALLLGALISSHTLLAYPIIERLGLLRRVPVVAAIGGTLLTDTLALVLLAVVISTVEPGALGWLPPLALLAVIAAASLWGLPRVGRFFFRQPSISSAEKALFALVVLLVLSSATALTGTDEVLGAFVAGVSLNGALARREELREHIEFVGRMLFIPFFFVYTGMLLELGQILRPNVLLVAGLLLALLVVGKGVAAWAVGVLHGYSGASRLLMVGMTTPQAAATLAITITASQAGILDDHVVDAVVLLIFVTCLAGPLVTSFVGERVRKERGEVGRGVPGAGDGDEPVRREM